MKNWLNQRTPEDGGRKSLAQLIKTTVGKVKGE
jgi:hypothetical protein